MKKIAVTGGIGCGKSYVCRVFEALNVPVFYADEEAKKLYENQDFLKVLERNFGREIFTDGTLDKATLANIVFKDTKRLAMLNDLIHPKVIADFQKWAAQQSAPYVIQETALVFECHLEVLFDYVVCVDAPKKEVMKRVMQRDSTDEITVQERMNHQIAVDEKRKKSDFVILNDGYHMLLPQILSLHEFLMAKDFQYSESCEQ